MSRENAPRQAQRFMTDSTLPPCRRMVILTEDRTTPFYAKTAMSLLKYRSADVLGLLDSTQAGQTAGALLGMGGDIPIVASLDDVDSPDSLVLGIAPPGGKVPTDWREIIVEAIGRGLDIVSGLHDFLADLHVPPHIGIQNAVFG